MDLTIIVADTCFCQPSYFFTRESPVFRDRLAGDSAKDDAMNCTKHDSADSDVSAKHTIVIEPHENVSPDDFAELCSIFDNPKFTNFNKSLESWTTILRLANQWSFPEVKTLAFRELNVSERLSSMPLVERIVFYQKYNAETTYLEPLYEKLLTRRESLTEKEGEALGLKSSLKISAARQELLRFMLPEADRAQPLPLKMRDAVLKVIQRLLGSSSTSSQSSSHVNGK